MEREFFNLRDGSKRVITEADLASPEDGDQFARMTLNSTDFFILDGDKSYRLFELVELEGSTQLGKFLVFPSWYGWEFEAGELALLRMRIKN
jgi:hypothetical protein